MQSLLHGKIITFWLWPNCAVQFCPVLFDLIWPSYSVTIETTRNMWGTAVKDVFLWFPSLLSCYYFLLLFYFTRFSSCSGLLVSHQGLKYFFIFPHAFPCLVVVDSLIGINTVLQNIYGQWMLPFLWWSKLSY